MPGSLSLERLGQRIVIIGPSCSGKSTLGERLGERIGAPFVELDALYWKPNWQPSGDEEFQQRIREATAGDRWVVAGNYRRHTVDGVWPRAESIVWLDIPMRLVVRRIITRSWQRSRRNELLWGTNYERFWPQLKLWNEDDSLIAYTWRNYPAQAPYYHGRSRVRSSPLHPPPLPGRSEGPRLTPFGSQNKKRPA